MRLVKYLNEVKTKKVRRYSDHNYWGKPVPSFGDPMAKLFIVGLAPGAHGANRTGRMFTGDSSGDWLYKALCETGFANQADSISADDGLILKNAYIGSVIHCAPPANKPAVAEIQNCGLYLGKEIRSLKNIQVIVCLGQLAFKQLTKIINTPKLKFGHGLVYPINDDLTVISSYHPSRQNTQTGRLVWQDWLNIFVAARKIISR